MRSWNMFGKLALFSFLALSMTQCSLRKDVISQETTFVREKPQTLPKPLQRSYSHNDYRHGTPLYEALQKGFISVEADVVLINGEMRVAHTGFGTTPGRTLQSLYLDPLKQIVEENDGSLYGNPAQTLMLLVDVKSDGDETYRALHEIFEAYKPILTRFTKDGVETSAVTVVISGHRPHQSVMEAQPVRYAAADGRLSDLKHKFKNSFMPLISANWNKNFAWRGFGPISAEETLKLRSIVQTAHENNQQIRFWSTPEKNPAAREAVWKELVQADVDYINTDHLPELQEWLLLHDKESRSVDKTKKPDVFFFINNFMHQILPKPTGAHALPLQNRVAA